MWRNGLVAEREEREREISGEWVSKKLSWKLGG
jgi:hypothetical protein